LEADDVSVSILSRKEVALGLTIHYSLSSDLSKPNEVRQLAEAVRQFALDLPFENVGEIIEFSGDDPSPENDTARWLRIQSEAHVEANDCHYRVPPKHAFAFSTWPGEGCEAANLGFCKYPAYLSVEGKRVATKLRGWSWHSFCKTQYASDRNCGGVRNFLRCHLGVIRILDFINATKLAKVEVSDEGGYWEQRDVKALVQEVGEWNEFIAGFTNELREAIGPELESAITSFPNFEHLEAKGLERLARLRQGKKPQP
jgi:hypothetical protein